jgi:hypothetical protein
MEQHFRGAGTASKTATKRAAQRRRHREQGSYEAGSAEAHRSAEQHSIAPLQLGLPSQMASGRQLQSVLRGELRGGAQLRRLRDSLGTVTI